ncbi:hypothetical protein ACTXMK_05310 [Psychrobacter celer]|uniref:hypothetical protein n=1 Tax=Psychrobacter celer TaxID=306572 RepID=UPI003FCFCAB6
MSNFINTQTNEEVSISIIDPATGTDCINDLLQIEHDQTVSLDDEYNWVADTDTIEYYQDIAAQYQTAYNLMHEIKQSGTEAQRAKLEEILDDAQGYETNDWAGYVINDINENNLV